MSDVIQPFHLLVIALAGWLNRQQQAIIDYLNRREPPLLAQSKFAAIFDETPVENSRRPVAMTELHTYNTICLLLKKAGVALVFVSMLYGCADTDIRSTINSSTGLLSAAMLSEDDVKAESSEAAEEMDTLNEVASGSNKYGKRLAGLSTGLENYDGLKLNFKVYLVSDINAFAMPDGSVRVFSSLMDIMEDEELMAIIGHEIGHVKFKHSYNQMRMAMVSQSTMNLLGQSGGYTGAMANSELGQVASRFIDARYSQSDELESDAFAVIFLRQQGMDPYAAVRAIEALQREFGDSNHFLSSHPSNPSRIEALKNIIAQQH